MTVSARSRASALPALALLLGALAAGCIDPADRRPGLWLTGEVETAPVADWSFTRDVPEIYVETRTWYGIPHSVTIVCASLDGTLYVGARNPEGKRWVENVARNPDVRLGIEGRVYERRLERVEEPDQIEAIRRTYGEKYGRPSQPPEERPPIWYWRVTERG